MLRDDFEVIDKTLAEAMRLAAESPGKYGGRYFARKYNRKNGKTEWLVLSTDDPDSKEARNEEVDVLAQCTPTKAFGIGHARYWIRENGTVDRDYLTRND